MESIWRDLRFALRSLVRTPGFTAASVLALALGIGATTALFSVAHAVLLRSLGWNDESRLVSIREAFAAQGLEGLQCSAPEYLDFRASPLFSAVGVYHADTAALQGEHAERISVGHATAGFFAALGVRPIVGRGFTDEEDLAGRDGVALLSYGAWQKRYGAAPDAIGRTVTLDGKVHAIVGVLPAAFRWDEPHELYVPFGFTPKQLREERGNRYLDAVARLAPGLSLQTGSARIEELAASLRATWPDSYVGTTRWSLSLTPLRDRFSGQAERPLYVLLGAVLFVLLIACGNVANLLLARGAARARELAVRNALGASRGRLVRLLLAESLLLALFGALGGLLVATWSLDVLLAAAPQSIKALADVTLDRSVLGLAAVLIVFTTLLFGLLPALQASRVEVGAALKDGSHGTSGPRAGRMRGALVVGQFALSLVLLVGAGLLLRSFAEVLRVPAGFTPEEVLAAKVSLGGPAYQPATAQARYWNEAVRRASALPGVESAGAINVPPLQGRTDWSYDIEGYVAKPGEPYPDDQFRRATFGTFKALRIAVKSGREFAESDDEAALPVALVNEAWVRRYFPGQDVIGKRLRAGGKEGKWRTIVGVVGDAHDLGLEAVTPPIFYACASQFPDDQMTLLVRAAGGSASSLAASVRALLAGLDASQPPDFIEPYEDRVAAALAPRRFPLQLLAAFAVLALVLSALGIYGVTSYAVTQRTREFGVRLAIGAQQGDVLLLVMTGAVRQAALGVAIGLCGALATAQLLSSQLYGVSARDPLTYLGIAGLLALVALVASWLPARRAMRVDPATALRAE